MALIIRKQADAPIMQPKPKRPVGRPRTGQAPDSDRQAKAKARLEMAGGRRISVNLTAVAVENLESIKRQLGIEKDTAVILLALEKLAMSRKGRAAAGKED